MVEHVHGKEKVLGSIPSNGSSMKIKKVLSFVFVGLVAYYTLVVFKDPYDHMFIHAVNLVIHEAGHTIFIFFGQFMNILGGSLLQVLVPFVFAVYFLLWQRSPISASIMLFWASINLIEVSIYAGDAISMNLPLLGHDEGDTSGHDWNNLLVMLGILKYTPIVEKVFVFLGYAVYSLGLATGVLGVIYNSKKDDSNE